MRMSVPGHSAVEACTTPWAPFSYSTNASSVSSSATSGMRQVVHPRLHALYRAHQVLQQVDVVEGLRDGHARAGAPRPRHASIW